MAATHMNNDQWLRSCFGVRNPKLSVNDRRARTESGVRFKFEDTTLGGSKAINSPAAFCEFSDLPIRGLTTQGAYTYGNPAFTAIMGDGDTQREVAELDQTSSHGLGRSYSEFYSDTGEYITLKFGLPKQNSLLSYFTSFYDSDAGAYARTGEGSSVVLQAAGALGTVIGMAMSPAFLVTRTVMFLANTPISKFYYVDGKMPMFWQAASIILNSIIVNAGVVPRLSGRNQSEEDIASQWQQVKNYHEMMPDIFRKNGGIDLKSVASRYNRLAIAYQEALTDIAIDATSMGGFIDSIRSASSNAFNGALTGIQSPETNEYILRYLNATEEGMENLDPTTIEDRVLMFSKKAQVDENGKEIPEVPIEGQTPEQAYSNRLARWSFSDSLMDHFRAAANEGSEYITWRVENTGATTESFSSSTGEPAIASGFNGMSGSARDLRFNAGQFQTGLGMLDSIGSAVGAVTGAVADGFKMEGIKALLGNAFVDIPDIVTGSSAKMPDMSYTMELRPWSNDPITRVMELHVPIAIALAMILPISTGLQSYGMPFICEGYSRSRVVCKVGAVTSMSISRGVSNLARNADGDPLGVTINWTLTDLSKIVHMPINTDMSIWSKFTQFTGKAIDGVAGGTAELLGGDGDARYGQAAAALLDPRTYDDGNKFTDLMAVYGGLSLQDQIYTGQKLKIKMLTNMTNFDSWMSASNFSNWLGTSTPFGRLFGIFSKGTAATN